MSGRVWRAVEAQHVVSTMKLVDTLAEQALLEQILEESKPPVPPECSRLHYLLSTPFRYGAPYPHGSRFRRAGMTPGVYYASKTAGTAVAELAFHRLLFFAESPATPWPANAGEHTVFDVSYRTTAGIDLALPPFDRDEQRWLHPTDYEPCQSLADAARGSDVQVIRYRSARDAGGSNVAILSCGAFTSHEPLERQTWRIHLGPTGVRAIGDSPARRTEFNRQAFANDPRIAAMRWDR